MNSELSILCGESGEIESVQCVHKDMINKRSVVQARLLFS